MPPGAAPPAAQRACSDWKPAVHAVHAHHAVGPGPLFVPHHLRVRNRQLDVPRIFEFHRQADGAVGVPADRVGPAAGASSARDVAGGRPISRAAPGQAAPGGCTGQARAVDAGMPRRALPSSQPARFTHAPGGDADAPEGRQRDLRAAAGERVLVSPGRGRRQRAGACQAGQRHSSPPAIIPRVPPSHSVETLFFARRGSPNTGPRRPRRSPQTPRRGRWRCPGRRRWATT